MKKVISFLIVMSLIFCFAGCKKEEEKKSPHPVNIEEYAKKGEIPEVPYKLGQNIEELKTLLEEANADSAHAGENSFYVDDSSDTVFISSGDYSFYYDKYQEEKGVTFLVTSAKAFGFERETVIIEVEEVLAKYDYVKEDFNTENSFFIYDPEGTVLKAQFGEYTVIFAFVENGLSATAIYKTNDWK